MAGGESNGATLVEMTRSNPLWLEVEALARTRFCFRGSPYFVWMTRPDTDARAFRLSQHSFVHAVDEWSCAVAAVLARVPRVELRSQLLLNLWEEHGNGSFADAHTQTFLGFLGALGADTSELAGVRSPDARVAVHTRAFNAAVRDFCLARPFGEGAALLGAIEYLYIDISAHIASHVHAARWLVAEQTHYTLHAEIDVGHANDLFALALADHEVSRERLLAAIELGAYWFWTLYRDMTPSHAV